ncbi:hypothetical protein FA13DRAFT_1802432 [Coprinellus micaceus]|uniref:Uncharacterized protein n=1 Tax=Coprinellus micaceus TaxID=71717 RepID=A0A4Y7SD80_COPMI|nr:hypothetical protein FA13DRAFT_1802432 [Coprinellus micaceus]
MGRPKLYSTKEERLAAARKRSQEHYYRNQESISLARRTRYTTLKSTGPPTRAASAKRRKTSLSDEEHKVKNRLKSQRYYERNKSNIRQKRQARRSAANAAHVSYVPAMYTLTVHIDTNTHQHLYNFRYESTHSGPAFNSWEQHSSYLAEQISSALGHASIDVFLEKVAVCYLTGKDSEALGQAYEPFEELKRRVWDHQHVILNRFGAGAPLRETMAMVSNLDLIIDLASDMIAYNLGHGYDGFLDYYEKGYLQYQRVYDLVPSDLDL